MTRFRGLVWRHVPPGAEPLHLGWILNATRGRWNTRRPRLPCIYTALTAEGAVAEYERHVALFGLWGERDLVSIFHSGARYSSRGYEWRAAFERRRRDDLFDLIGHLNAAMTMPTSAPPLTNATAP